MTAPPLAAALDCPAMLIAGMAARGIEVTASLAPPLVCGCWKFTCPHGAHYWLTPTAAQQAVWAQEAAFAALLDEAAS